MKELGYDNDAWVYFRVLGVLFSTYALVFVADDDAIRQIVGFLNTRGIVELFVAVGNVRGIVAHDDESTIHDEGINEAVGKVVNDTNEYEHEAVNEVGEKETFQDSTGDEVPNIEDLSHNTTEVEQEECEKETSQDSAGDEVSDIEDLGHSTAEVELEAGEKETSQDSVDLLVNFEVAFDLDDEVEGIRVNVRADIHENSTYVSEGEENNDVECEGQPIVGNDLVEEDGDVTKIEGKLQDHERDYIEFEDHKQFKEAVRKYDIAKGVALRTNKNPFLTSKHIENVFRDRILADPSMKVENLKQHCRKELGVYASFNKCQRARLNVLREKRGSYVDEYVTLWGDGKNQMFPVAWAAVEGEGNESWKWFLTKLVQDLNHPDGEALEHKMCARHVYSNCNKKRKWMNMKIQFWNCVRSTFVEDFDDQLKLLEEMRATSTIPPLHWSHAYFTGNSKCDVVDNNLVEAFSG
ncbi:hypothetical protein V6N13_063549 [Hibiscus sabdariffa]